MGQYSISLDLGASKIAIYYYVNGRAEIFKFDSESENFPAAVYYYNKQLFGKKAIKEAGKEKGNPKYLFKNLKCLIGRCFSDPYVQKIVNTSGNCIIEGPNNSILLEVIENGEKVYKSPNELLCLLVNNVISIFTRKLGGIKYMACAYPPSYNEIQRNELKEVFIQTGIRHIEMIPETTAVCYLHGLEEMNQNTSTLVIDSGSATTDLSIVVYRDGSLEILYHDGNGELGGQNYTECLISYVYDRLQRDGYDIEKLDRAKNYKLQGDVEHIKCALKNLDVCDLFPKEYGLCTDDNSILISAHQLTIISGELNTKVGRIIESLLKQAKKNGIVPNKILFSGGGMKLESLIDKVCTVTGMENPYFNNNEPVAKGLLFYLKSVMQSHDDDDHCNEVKHYSHYLQPVQPVQPAPVQPVQPAPIQPVESEYQSAPIQPVQPESEDQSAPIQPVESEDQPAPIQPVPSESEDQSAPIQPIESEDQSAPIQPVETEYQPAPIQPVETEDQPAPIQPVQSEDQPAPIQPVETEYPKIDEHLPVDIWGNDENKQEDDAPINKSSEHQNSKQEDTTDTMGAIRPYDENDIPKLDEHFDINDIKLIGELSYSPKSTYKIPREPVNPPDLTGNGSSANSESEPYVDILDGDDFDITSYTQSYIQSTTGMIGNESFEIDVNNIPPSRAHNVILTKGTPSGNQNLSVKDKHLQKVMVSTKRTTDGDLKTIIPSNSPYPHKYIYDRLVFKANSPLEYKIYEGKSNWKKNCTMIRHTKLIRDNAHPETEDHKCRLEADIDHNGFITLSFFWEDSNTPIYVEEDIVLESRKLSRPSIISKKNIYRKFD